MHYTPNTSLRVPIENQGRKIGGPTIPSQQRNLAPRVMQRRSLTPGVLYTLSYIKKEENGNMAYSFKGQDGSLIVETFRSCQEADMFIAGIKNEAIPEYEQFYKKLKT